MKKNNEEFEKIYNETYSDLLRYVIVHCRDLEDVNDILQDTYIKVYEIMAKRDIEEVRPFIFGIAKNMLKRYRWKINKIKAFFINDDFIDSQKNENFKASLVLEDYVLNELTVEEIWKHIKSKKAIIGKIFYLYYCEDLTIKQIAHELSLNESNIKNYLYRTRKELVNIYKEKVKNEK